MAPASTTAVTLDPDDPQVRAAQTAEQTAYDHYGLDYTDHYIDLDDLDAQLRVAKTGQGPPLVLMIGGEGKGLTWLPLLPELDDHTLYVVDRPGGGLSDGVDYRSHTLEDLAVRSTTAVFDHFNLDSAPIVANSMGGLWTLRFALAQPDRVSAIGLLGCPALYPGTSAPLPMRIGSISFLSGLIVERLMQANNAADVRDAWEFLGHPKATRERLSEAFAEAWYRMETLPTYVPTWIGILQSALRLRGANPQAAFTTDDLQSISAPVVLLWGSDDPFGSIKTGRAGARSFPTAEFHEVGMGHLPWLDNPARCGELLETFLTDHD